MARSDQRIRARLEKLEAEARLHPRRHALRLLLLIAIGYSYPLLLAALSLASLALLLALAPSVDFRQFEILIFYVIGLLFLASTAAIILLSLFVKLPDPEGQLLKPGEGLALRELIDEARQSVGAPPVHQLYVDEDFNAGIWQRRRFGFWGARKNYLVVGIPLLLALNPQQLRCVIIHELAHLRAGHGSFGARIHRVMHTWMTLAKPFNSSGKLRWLAMGWFVNWYGCYFATSTLAKRRIHEYESDRLIAKAQSNAAAAHALMAVDWHGHRLGKSFWPNLIHEAAQHPLPPADILARMAEFFSTTPSAEEVARWKRRELRARTPITSDHPCLLDRLSALEMADLLNGFGHTTLADGLEARIDPNASAAALLSDCHGRIWSLVNAVWKAKQIGHWRQAHAAAKLPEHHAEEEIETLDNESAPEKSWRALQKELAGCAASALHDRYRQFIAQNPSHAPSTFALGRQLLNDDNPEAESLIETAMKLDSSFTGPGLHVLLEHYRQLGRDEEAEEYRARLEKFESSLTVAKKERLKVSRRDQFLAHDLNPRQVAQLRRLLIVYPQVRAAYLVRKKVALFADQASYVLAVRRRSSLLPDTRADRFLINCLRSQLNLSCAVIILERAPRSVSRKILQTCAEPIFLSND